MARLVVVDATEWVLSMLADALREAGHEVTQCTTAEAALAAVRGVRPDGLVCDVELPDGDGAWVVEHVRAEPPPVGAVPILLLATTAAAEARAAALRAGADACVAKPYRAGEVLRQMGALLRRNAPSERAPAIAPRPARARHVVPTKPIEIAPESIELAAEDVTEVEVAPEPPVDSSAVEPVEVEPDFTSYRPPR